LRWINAQAAQAGQADRMINRFRRFDSALFESSLAAHDDAAARRLVPSIPAAIPAAIPASWPAGVSYLAQALTACERRDEVRADWLKAAPNAIVLPPAYPPARRCARQPQDRD
jgi:hypothetical protein